MKAEEEETVVEKSEKGGRTEENKNVEKAQEVTILVSYASLQKEMEELGNFKVC